MPVVAVGGLRDTVLSDSDCTVSGDASARYVWCGVVVRSVAQLFCWHVSKVTLMLHDGL
jgi:hypothetical protein